jgi:abequosyltransferase
MQINDGEGKELPLLTIAIPTFNRSHHLSRLLDSLVPQLKNEPYVELLISDNASDDATAALLEQHRRQGLSFRAILNETNIGADGNFVQCFTEASGKYVWIIGDDDILAPKGLRPIVELLSGNEFDILHLHSVSSVSGSPFRTLQQPPKIEIIHDARTFTLRAHVFLTFISANIINRQRVLSLPHRPFSELIGTNLAQLGWTYTAVRYFRTGAYIPEPLLAAGVNAEGVYIEGGYDLFNVFGTNLKEVTESWLVEPALVRIVLNGTLQRFLPVFLLRSKLQIAGFVAEKPEVLLHTLFSGNYRYWLFVYPLGKLPAWLGRFWLLGCRAINRLDRALGNPMLR